MSRQGYTVTFYVKPEKGQLNTNNRRVYLLSTGMVTLRNSCVDLTLELSSCLRVLEWEHHMFHYTLYFSCGIFEMCIIKT